MADGVTRHTPGQLSHVEFLMGVSQWDEATEKEAGKLQAAIEEGRAVVWGSAVIAISDEEKPIRAWAGYDKEKVHEIAKGELKGTIPAEHVFAEVPYRVSEYAELGAVLVDVGAEIKDEVEVMDGVYVPPGVTLATFETVQPGSDFLKPPTED